MSDSNPLPRLRLSSDASPEELAQRFQRERRAQDLQREARLAEEEGSFRIGSVPYLNAVPLTRGLEDGLILEPPSKLAAMLERNEVDAALVSIVEVLLKDRYDVLDGIGICSLGEVQSVVLAHKRPLEDIDEIHCDPASLTSVMLLKVLLAERGLSPKFAPLATYEAAELPPAALVIGDPAIDLLRSPNRAHELWDLGAAWFELTSLPFVYAIWALRRGIPNHALRRQLREARDFGLDTLDSIIHSRKEYDLDFRRDYLGWHIHYHLSTDERRGIARFMDLLSKHQLGPVFPPNWVS